MRDPTVDAGIEAAINEAVKVFEFYKNSWLKPTTIDWSDVDLRMEARLRAAQLPMPEDVREVIYARLDKAEPLPPRRRGRHRKGEFVPRNVVIVKVLRQLERRRFKPISGGHSGCFIVECALERVGIKLGERRIEKIWGSRARTITDIRKLRAYSPN
jgi:hypothetical protein